MKKVKAIFRGKNGSCGYETGREYEIIIGEDRQTSTKKAITIEQVGLSRGYCEYDTVISFLNNWDNIRVVN